MTERELYIAKRRSILKGQITSLRGLISRDDFNPKNAQIRCERLTELFHAYEELHVELELIRESEDDALQLQEVQDAYYEVAAEVATITNSGGTRANADGAQIAQGFASSTFMERQKSVKLPVADLPKFDGEKRKWLTFKNQFKSMIDSRTDIDDLNKFIYLRSCLTGSAKQKLIALDASAENYKKGWDKLVGLYEERRLLVRDHYAALFNNGYCKFTPMQSASEKTLSKLVDDADQQIIMLKSIGVQVDEGMIVYLLERSLPSEVKNEWDKQLDSNIIPGFDKFYKFIYAYINRIEDNNDGVRSHNETGRKRSNDFTSQNVKARRSNSGARALVTDIACTCGYCGKGHLIYKCTEFDKLNVSQRWDAARAKALCFNCLRDHKPPCKSTKRCKKCDKNHHTLLHNEGRNGNDKKNSNTA